MRRAYHGLGRRRELARANYAAASWCKASTGYLSAVLDVRYGVKFKKPEDFIDKIDGFRETTKNGGFHPRDYVLEHLTLKQRAESYLNIWQTVQSTS
jgi:hypothetical protein